jgi:hypothetical protein
MDGWKIIQNGSVLDFATNFNFRITQAIGAGMPPIENISTSFGLLDGSLFQRQRSDVRTFTLTGVLAGSSVTGLHADRKKLINAVKPDRTATQQPVVIQYTGAGSTLQASAFLSAGLELGEVEVYHEQLALRFEMFDPYFEKSSSTNVALTTRATVSNANHILQRSPCGAWASLGSGVNDVVYDLLSVDNTVYVGGTYTSVAGSTVYGIAKWNHSTQQWSKVSSGSGAGTVYTVTRDAQNNIYIGGNFSTVDNLTSVGQIAKLTGTTWSALGTGTGPGATGVYAIAIDHEGTLYAGGNFETAGSETAYKLAKWDGTYWSAVGSSSALNGINGKVAALAVGYDNTLYLGGQFNTIGPLSASHVAQWDGSNYAAVDGGVVSTQANGFNATGEVLSLLIDTDGTLLAGGDFFSAGGTAASTGGITACGVARYNGISWQPLGADGIQSGSVFKMARDATTDRTWLVGAFGTIDNLPHPSGIVQWNGTSWVPVSLKLPANTLVFGITLLSDGAAYIGYSSSGTTYAAAVTSVTNNGTANAYPILSCSGPGRLYELYNATTGEGIWFNLDILRGEVVTLDLRPGQKTFTSSIRGNIISTVLPGSEVSTWHLAPGANNVNLFIDSASALAALGYTERFWSIDA